MKRTLLLLAALVLSVPAAFSQSWDGPQWAVVNSSSCFLRLKPDYESGNESQALMGTVLRVKGAERYWRQVDAPDSLRQTPLCLRRGRLHSALPMQTPFCRHGHPQADA